MSRQDPSHPDEPAHMANPGRQTAGTIADCKLLIAVVTCRKNEHRRALIEKHWAAEARSRYGFEVVYLVGNGDAPSYRDGDTLFLRAGDHYEHLPRKVYELCKFAAHALSFDYLLKTDDDVFVNLERLAALQLEGAPYAGGMCGESPDFDRNWHLGKTRSHAGEYTGAYQGPWCSGSGYFLSRRAATVVAGFADLAFIDRHIYEDKMVADILRGAGLQAVFLQNAVAMHLVYHGIMSFCLNPGGWVSPATVHVHRAVAREYAVLHLGSFGRIEKIDYRLDEDTLEILFDKIDMCLRDTVGGRAKAVRAADPESSARQSAESLWRWISLEKRIASLIVKQHQAQSPRRTPAFRLGTHLLELHRHPLKHSPVLLRLASKRLTARVRQLIGFNGSTAARQTPSQAAAADHFPPATRDTTEQESRPFSASRRYPKPLVSMVLVAEGSQRDVLASIQSALEQTFNDFELCLSVQPATGAAEAAWDRVRQHPQLRLLETGSPTLPQASQEAFELTRGCFVVRLAPGDLLKPHALESWVAVMHAAKDVGCACSILQEISAMGDHVRYHAPFLDDAGEALAHPIRPMPSAMFRARDVQRAGGWRAVASMADEQQLALRVSAVARVIGVAEILCARRWE